MRKSDKTIKKIMTLRADGMGIKTIARELRIHPDTSRRYCYIADKIMSLEPEKVEEGIKELEKYQPRSIAELNRRKRIDEARTSINPLKKIIEIFGGFYGRKE